MLHFGVVARQIVDVDNEMFLKEVFTSRTGHFTKSRSYPTKDSGYPGDPQKSPGSESGARQSIYEVPFRYRGSHSRSCA